MKAVIISVGTELVSGEITDTNAGWLSRRLAEIGISAVRHMCVGDDEGELVRALGEGARLAGTVIVTGGIGPTPDDITRQAAAKAAGVELERDAGVLAHVEGMFAGWGREMSGSNAIQADFPRGSAIIPNPRGTAAGFRMKMGGAEVIVLPGVPVEMKRMWEETVSGHLVGRGGGGVVVTRTVNCFGRGESDITEAIKELMDPRRNPSVGDTAEDGVIRVRIRARAGGEAQALELIEETKREVRERLGEVVFGEDEETLESAVVGLLLERGETLTAGESCTGGLFAKRITDISGSSGCFIQGVVAYANKAKATLLGVPAELIERHGAVSEEVAAAMATGARERCGADYGVSTTGVAGPGGGSEEKPVGLVFIGVATRAGVEVRRLALRGSRGEVRDRACKSLLNMLRVTIISR